jgi:anti-sigma factor RsiW
MMTCRELVEQLLDFLANELPPESCERIRAHLGECPPCVVLVETYQITIRLTRRLPRAPLPAGLEERLRAALRQSGQSPG